MSVHQASWLADHGRGSAGEYLQKNGGGHDWDSEKHGNHKVGKNDGDSVLECGFLAGECDKKYDDKEQADRRCDPFDHRRTDRGFDRSLVVQIDRGGSLDARCSQLSLDSDRLAQLYRAERRIFGFEMSILKRNVDRLLEEAIPGAAYRDPDVAALNEFSTL